ncbi:hypothetical protein HAX54_021809 [Datura stramonium]|uniref:Uncharacterized protein n=1 Tax=Datura stramonium TaxID=4076 RepID=A0ABS8UU29_DATST|nr:hypothetical protein [Datura stramonium]
MHRRSSDFSEGSGEMMMERRYNFFGWLWPLIGYYIALEVHGYGLVNHRLVTSTLLVFSQSCNLHRQISGGPCIPPATRWCFADAAGSLHDGF